MQRVARVCQRQPILVLHLWPITLSSLPVPKGRYVLPEGTGRMYGPYVRVVRIGLERINQQDCADDGQRTSWYYTHYPCSRLSIRPVNTARKHECSKRHPCWTSEFTGREHGRRVPPLTPRSRSADDGHISVLGAIALETCAVSVHRRLLRA